MQMETHTLKNSKGILHLKLTKKKFASISIKLFKAAVRKFLGLKNDPKLIFEQVHNQPVFKTICLP